jgi:predicted acylesterase/phospholipase RssA
MKIGLVLCGGGAKGAYQVGCWKALKEVGMDKFAVVSGTSVGALNGPLIATGDYQRAVKIWMELTEGHILLSTEARKRFVKFVFGVMLIIGTLFYHIWVLVHTALLLAPGLLISGTILWFVFFDTLRMKHLSSGPLEIWLLTPVVFVGLPFIWYVTYLFIKNNTPPFGFTFVRTFIRKLAVLLGRWLPIGVNYPLLNLIKSNLNTQQLRESEVTLYCTVSVATEYRDPYQLQWFETYKSSERRRRYREWIEMFSRQFPGQLGPRSLSFLSLLDLEPSPHYEVVRGAIQKAVSGWIPLAIDVTALESDEEIFSSIVQSANLPLVFERGTWLGKVAVDGGISDNAPILPALHAGCTLVIVIYLNHLMRPTLEQISDDLRARYKWELCRELSAEQAAEAYEVFRQEGTQPELPFDMNDTQFLFVVPSKPLGRATAFRGGNRASSLIDLGYKDMKAALAAHSYPQSLKRSGETTLTSGA